MTSSRQLQPLCSNREKSDRFCAIDSGIGEISPHNGRFLRHRFSPKPTSVTTEISLPKRNHVAKEAVSTASQTKTQQPSDCMRQTEQVSSDEAVALRKNHVIRPVDCDSGMVNQKTRRIIPLGWHIQLRLGIQSERRHTCSNRSRSVRTQSQLPSGTKSRNAN